MQGRAASQVRQSHSPRVGPGQVGTGDEGLQLAGPSGVARQHGAAPFAAGAAVPIPQPGPRHRDLHRPEAARQPARSMAVPMAGRVHSAARVAPAPQRRLQLLLDRLLDDPADPTSAGQPRAGRTKHPRRRAAFRPAPCCYARRWRDLHRHANAGHGSLNKPETTPPPISHHIRDGTAGRTSDGNFLEKF
jgi:hypothetical protein